MNEWVRQRKGIVRILLWQGLLSSFSFDYFTYFNLDIICGDSFVLKQNIENKFLGDRTFTKKSCNKMFKEKLTL